MTESVAGGGHRSQPEIGICILTYNSRRVITSCLESVARALAGVDSVVVVVDNQSTDDTSSLVRRLFEDVEVIETGANLGYARGNNVGAKFLIEQRQVPFVLFLNPDVQLDPETVPELRRALDMAPGAACAAGVALSNGARSRESYRQRPDALSKLLVAGVMRYLPVFKSLLGGLVARLEERYFARIDQLSNGSPVYTFSGACFLVTSAAFQAVGGFDPATFLFQEELILSERLHAAGYHVVAAPAAEYRHLGGHSVRRRPVASFWYFIRSEQHLLKRYYRWALPARWALLLYRSVELALFAAYTTGSRALGLRDRAVAEHVRTDDVKRSNGSRAA